MAAPLSICTKEERGSVICFLFVEVAKPAEITYPVNAQYVDSCLSLRKIRASNRELIYGTTKRLASPSTSTTEDNMQVVQGKGG
ncbi:hypothetical protein TNCV_2128521 [Trichonephila clavipes]|nr:hypothetical protein TNCV_2128521 [Trichonephila clavipes]